jgi:hypothetical protein
VTNRVGAHPWSGLLLRLGDKCSAKNVKLSVLLGEVISLYGRSVLQIAIGSDY